MTLFRALSRIGTRLFFGGIEVDGEVPERGPILIVSNHTNGLVDALVITAAIRRRVSLTAKSTLKKNPLLALVVWLADAVPLYRKQDDVEMAKNFDSFVEVKRRLRNGGAICIFPEGMSHSDASMREFRTGAARIALESRGIGLRIVPAGLHYDAKQRFRSPALVRFGEPLDVDSFAGDVPALNAELERRVSALTNEFHRVREALWLRWTAELLDTRGEDPRPLDQEERAYAARTRLIAELRDGYEKTDRERVSSVIAELRRYRRDLRRLGIAQHEVFLSMHPLRALFFTIRELELLIVGGVIAAAGAVQHGVAFAMDRLLTKKLSVDLDQFASNAIFYGFAIFPLIWACGIAAAWTLGSWRWALAYVLAIPFTLLYTILWSDRIVRAARRARTFFLFLFRRGAQRELQTRGRELIAHINELRETLP
jgi:glycerol-3-phosphate O-acyltransferase/dihydroxyacetone phosphate acyltransferase